MEKDLTLLDKIKSIITNENFWDARDIEKSARSVFNYIQKNISRELWAPILGDNFEASFSYIYEAHEKTKIGFKEHKGAAFHALFWFYLRRIITNEIRSFYKINSLEKNLKSYEAEVEGIIIEEIEHKHTKLLKEDTILRNVDKRLKYLYIMKNIKYKFHLDHENKKLDNFVKDYIVGKYTSRYTPYQEFYSSTELKKKYQISGNTYSKITNEIESLLKRNENEK